MSRLSLLIQSCDDYEWFWSGTFCTLDFYWDFNYPVYFATEEKDIHSIEYHFNHLYRPNSKINLINHTRSQDANGFSTRMIDALNKIDSKYVIYMQEDMWLKSKLDSSLIEQLLNFMEYNNVDSIKIHSKLHWYSQYFFDSTNMFFEGLRLLKMKEVEDNLFLSHNATIWRREYLLKHQRENESAWDNEVNGSLRMFSEPSNHYHYNINWYNQPGAAEKGELSLYGRAHAHVIWEMMNMRMKFNLNK